MTAIRSMAQILDAFTKTVIMINEQSIKAGDIKVSYNEIGEGENTVIFIHGFPFNKSSWNEQLEALKDKAKVISYDIRGFGKSETGSKKASISVYADDLIHLMDALKIDKAVVCGLSMGGYILLNAVDRYPDRFKALILADTQCLADSEEGKEKRYTTIQDIEKNGLEPFAEKFLKGAFSKQAKKENVEMIKKIILSTSPDTVKSALVALAERKESCSHLKKIKVPTLVVCGEEDELTTLPQSEFLFNNISGAKMQVIEKAGHLSNIEKSDLFNKYLKDFIAAL